MMRLGAPIKLTHLYFGGMCNPFVQWLVGMQC